MIVKYKNIQNTIAIETLVRDEAQTYAAIFRHLPFGIIYRNMNGGAEYINPVGQTLFGIEIDDVNDFEKDLLSLDIIDSDGISLPEDQFPGIITLAKGEAQKDIIIGIKKSNDSTAWLKVNSEIINDSSNKKVGVVTSFVDLTQERDAQFALQAQTKRAQMAVESAQMGIWDWLPETQEMIWDKKLFQIYGYADDKSIVPSKAWEKAVHPDDWDRVKREAHDMIKNANNKEIDYRAVWPNGSIRHLRSQASIIKGSHGEVKRVIGVTHDVTNAVMAEKNYGSWLTSIR